MLLLACVLAAAAPGSVCAAAPDQPAEGISFVADVRTALRHAKARKAVTIVYFESASCSWCRKMKTVTFADRGVAALGRKAVWVKVNVRDNPMLAAAFGVGGVPVTAVLNVNGQILTQRGGYLSPEMMKTFLRKWLDKAQATGEGVADLEKMLRELQSAPTTRPAARGQVSEALRKLVTQLAQPDRAGRAKLMEAAVKLPKGRWPGLLALMADRHLAVRAAAGEVLAAATGQELPFDPFAPAAARATQLAAWRDWVRRAAAAGPTTRPAAPKPPKPKPKAKGAP